MIEPFQNGYLKMLGKAKQIGEKELPDMKKGQNTNMDGIFQKYFKEQDYLDMQHILAQGKYIPQEILSIEDL